MDQIEANGESKKKHETHCKGYELKGALNKDTGSIFNIIEVVHLVCAVSGRGHSDIYRPAKAMLSKSKPGDKCWSTTHQEV